MISFEPLRRENFPLLAEWLRQPHVAEWWWELPDLDFLEEKYGPRIDGDDPTHLFVISLEGRPIGLIQTYRLADNPEYEQVVGVEDGAGIDLLIGEPELVGRGLGPRVIREFAARVVFELYPEVRRCMAGPSVRNIRSQRAFEKAGFRSVRDVEVPDEPDPERVMVLERESAEG